MLIFGNTMRREVSEYSKKLDMKGWKKIGVEFGQKALEVFVPPNCIELSMKDVPVISNPKATIEEALTNPIGTLGLKDIIRGKRKPPSALKVAIAVSDITRPVPYKGEKGILNPILNRLKSEGILKKNIKIIVATGMHRPSSYEEKVEMYGKEVTDQYMIIDHDCENSSLLENIGKTKRGTNVYVNCDFYFSDLKIATGLVESHFMTGISGGRKSICPGLVDVKTIQRFHGPHYLEDPNSTNLFLEGNPCHEEALEVAKTVGVDFIVNVTLDKGMHITQVFAGHLVEAHMRAFKMIKGYAEIPLAKQFDIVLTHGGYVGRDHYQTAKAGIGAMPAVKEGGIIIIAAHNRDKEPIGSPEYKYLLRLMKIQGPEKYLELLKNPNWQFTKDQWEPEEWGKLLKKVGSEGLIYCSGEISREDYTIIPGTSGYEFLSGSFDHLSSLEKVQRMVQNALFESIVRLRKKNIEPSVCFIREGPYAIPTFRRSVLT
jgi:nickel-dependent lactate racemase